MKFSQSDYELNTGDSVTLSMEILYEGEDKTVIEGEEIGKLGLTYSYSKSGVAEVTSEGVLNAMAAGTTTVTAKSGNGNADDFTVTVSDTSTTPEETGLEVLSSPLSASMIYSKNACLKNNSVMQSFDIDSNGSIFYDQVAGNYAFKYNIVHGRRSVSEKNSYMEVLYFGHGTNMAVEKVGSDNYIWMGCYGSLQETDLSYRNPQTVARFKYESGKTLMPEDCADQFYIPGKHNCYPALDVDNDILCISYSSNTFALYSLKDAEALPVTEVTLSKRRTYGGTYGDSNPEVTENTTALVHNLSALTPLHVIKLNVNPSSPDDLGYYDNQGFDVYDGLLFYFEGESNGGDTSESSNAYVTVFDYDGNIVYPRTRVAFLDDLTALGNYGLTTIGSLEGEGIKIHDGYLYLGFAARNSYSSSDERMNQIIRYPFREK
ncbi:MAG: Ig-like domain-containing protein [Bacteroidales bacterium]|nr:Ig-like domain-containing protein [Bacteroidales bacterium]MCI2145877.1 Ig-like domain-containing protein [Bacteroidales bacterium]